MSSTTPKLPENDISLDTALRPHNWEEYVGQKRIKDNLTILLRAAQERNHSPEHVLFYGPPGLGKTTLAHLIAKECDAGIKVTSGPAISKIGDLASLLTNLSAGDVLFIDEIHRLGKQVEEVLYPAMESGVLDIIIGKGPSARSIQLELPAFTLVAATTRIALLSSPLRSRFGGGIFRLEYYSPEEIGEIIKRSASLLSVVIDKDGVEEIARRSRFTPRTANYLLKRCRDFAQVNRGPLDKKTIRGALALLEIDELGLHGGDRHLLLSLIEKFSGGPVGLNTLSTLLSEEESTIAEVNEPYLIQIGLLERTKQGRVVTDAAYKHLGVPGKRKQQNKLL
ncbi:MAG: Holliday junction branch migration DNA helicase RuvB [Candidatus Paceibacterota bacterium]